ncbi:MAG: hypothetical protein AAF543_11850 [Pseudomonadota bacterium]
MATGKGGFDGWREAAEAAKVSLRSLSPAECLVLLDPEGADPKELIRVTLLDLIAKKAIHFERRPRQTFFMRRTVEDPYLIAGSDLRRSGIKHHEHLILDIVRREGEVSLKRFAREVARALRKARAFKDAYVVEDLSKAGLIVEERRFALFRHKYLSEKGERVRAVLKDLRDHAARHMDGWIGADSDKAALFLALVGTNILIMPEILQRLDTAFSPLVTVSAGVDVELSFSNSLGVPLPDGFSQSFSDACDALQIDGTSFNACFDSLGSGAFDGGSSGGGGDGGGGGGDGGGGGGD